MNSIPIPVFQFLAGFIATSGVMAALFLLGVVVRAFSEPAGDRHRDASYVEALADEVELRSALLTNHKARIAHTEDMLDMLAVEAARRGEAL